MSLTPIPNPSGWHTQLLARLGLPRFKDWLLSDQVSPVALVDSSVTLQTTAVPPLFGAPSTAGLLVAPVANTRLADTGQLAAGAWSFTFLASHGEAVGFGQQAFTIRRRNAADGADIWAYRYNVPSHSLVPLYLTLRCTLALNERLVIENLVAGTAGIAYNGLIFAIAG